MDVQVCSLVMYFLKHRTLFLPFWLVGWLFISLTFFYSPSPSSYRISHIPNLSDCFIIVRISIGNIVYFLINIFKNVTHINCSLKMSKLISFGGERGVRGEEA